VSLLLLVWPLLLASIPTLVIIPVPTLASCHLRHQRRKYHRGHYNLYPQFGILLSKALPTPLLQSLLHPVPHHSPLVLILSYPHTSHPSRDLIFYLIPNASSNHTSNAAPSAPAPQPNAPFVTPAPAHPPNKPLPPQHSAHQLASQALQKRLWSHQQHISGRQLLLKNKESRYPRDTVLSIPQQLQEDITELRAYIAEERAKNVKWGNMLYDALDYERMGLLGEKRLEALLMELEGSELMGYGWSTDVTWSTDAPS
jgi:hypothetical protein